MAYVVEERLDMCWEKLLGNIASIMREGDNFAFSGFFILNWLNFSPTTILLWGGVIGILRAFDKFGIRVFISFIRTPYESKRKTFQILEREEVAM